MIPTGLFDPTPTPSFLPLQTPSFPALCSTLLPSCHTIQHSPILSVNFYHSPLVWINCNGPRLAQLTGYQHFFLSAISCGNGDALISRVGPVDVLVDPVDSQALRGVKRVNKSYLLRRVTGLVDVCTDGRERRALLVDAERNTQ